ncbi:MAG: 50S ribosomal protein L13 [Chloroflexi bacterium]|nr:50S ribosomal protein L13 [Chloroflexota bacterium]
MSAKQFDRRWQVVDAGGRPLGRVASEAARLLLGKHKPDYEPHLPMGDYVIVINAAAVVLTGNKAQQKVYYRHSGYPGNLRQRTFEEQMERDPRKVLERAIRGMLPHTRLGRELFRHLRVYSGADHPHEAQLRAGTGARARRRAAAEARAAEAALAERPPEEIVEDGVAEDEPTVDEATVDEAAADETDDTAADAEEATDDADENDE